jgi:CubicO group peptidase (beta-lactamase class C family)
MLRLGRLPAHVKVLSVVLLIGGGLLLLTGTRLSYIIRVIWYQFAGIEDYQIFPARTVAAGEGQPWSLASDYNQANLDSGLLQTIEGYGPIAFLVLQNNEIVYERYWENHNSTAYSASFSMAKGIVSLLVGIALEEGKLQSLDQPVADFIPEFSIGDKANITLLHLLTMTSGLDWDEAYSSPFSPTTELYYGDDIYRLVVNLPLKHEPGTVWYYSSADTQILGIALEAAIGQPLSDYASERLWKRIGAEQDASWSLDREQGVIKSNCCFNSTARDFARLGQLVLQGGMWNNEQIVPSDYLAQAIQPVAGLRDRQGDPVNYYGYQFWITGTDDQSVPFFNGILGQYIFVMPHLNAVVVRLGHRDDPNFMDGIAYQQAAQEILKSR